MIPRLYEEIWWSRTFLGTSNEKILNVRKMTPVSNTTHIQKMSLLRFRHLFSLSAVLFIVLASVSILFTLAQYSTRTYAAPSSFTFTATGDYANTSATTANLQLMA